MNLAGDPQSWDWVLPKNTKVGSGTSTECLTWSLGKSDSVALVVGSNKSRLGSFWKTIEESSQEFVVISHEGGEPELNSVLEKVELCRARQVGAVIGIGGGSVIDSAKAIAAFVPIPESHDPLDYLEVIGKGQPIPQEALPVCAVPTTAGTGAEATKNSVIKSLSKKVKVSLRHASMVPDQVILDPELCVSMPPNITASTGMDALTQLIEAYITKKRNPLTDGYCLEGLRLIARSLNEVWTNPDNLKARQDMLIAGYFSGVALANSGLGAVHGFAGPMGGMFSASHGNICASLLPAVMKQNLEKISSLDNLFAEDLRKRLNTIARILVGDKTADAEDLVAFVSELKKKFSIPSMLEMGVTPSDWKEVVEKSLKASSMKGNPVSLSETDLMTILKDS